MGIDASHLLTALAGFALRGGIILLVLALAAWGARRRSASLRHGLWAAALAAQLVLPLAATTLPRWTVAMPALPIDAISRGAEGPAPGHGAPARDDATSRPAPERRPPGRSGAAAFDLPRLLLLVWFGGTVLLLARRAMAEARLRRWVASTRPIADPRRLQAMSEASAALGLRQRVRMLESERASVPLVCGGWRPRIVLPVTSAGWDTSTLRSVLLHELAHVRRGDVRWNLLAHLVRAVYWFDPLCWLAVHRMRVEAEQAADDAVIAAGERPSGYAGMLLDFAGAAVLPAPAAALAFLGRSGLGARIEAILSGRDRRPPARREVIAGTLALAATVGLVAAAAPARSGAPAARDPARRAARFENHPGSPVRILAAEVLVLPAAGGEPGEVRLTRPRLEIENRASGRRISALQLEFVTPGVSTDRVWEKVDLAPGQAIDLRLAERIWSNQARAALAARLVIGVSAVRFDGGDSWSLPGADALPPREDLADEETPAPTPVPASPARDSRPPAAENPPVPEESVVPTAPPPAGSGARRAPTPMASSGRTTPPREPVSYLAARFENPRGAPLVIDDARTPVFARGGHPSTTALPVVTFRNVTDRRITSVRLRFKAGTDAHAVTVVRTPIGPHGMLVYRRDSFELEGDPAQVAVQVIGVGFEDGTSWGTLSSTIDTRDEWIYPLEQPGRP
jgi:beta-lactamase regulating signal transducer with metallopeptidase domain